MTDTPEIFKQVKNDWPDCLKDESRMTGHADSIAFPCSEHDLTVQLAYAAEHGLGVTVQGARTGIAGGAVPQGGHIVNLGRMSRVLGLREADGVFLLRVQPGLLLADLRTWLSQAEPAIDEADAVTTQTLERLRDAPRQFFAPDPTETGASLGGMASANASGARSFFYGPIRGHIESLRVVLADGAVLALGREGTRAQGRAFALRAETGRIVQGTLPAIPQPAVKNAAGYFVHDDMALIDLFMGSEGTMGVVTELELRLAPAPPVCWGALLFFPSESDALDAVERIRERQGADRMPGAQTFDRARLAQRAAGTLVAMEFFDNGTLNLLRRRKQMAPSFGGGIPDMPEAWHTGVYLEWHADSEAAAETALMDAVEQATTCGGDEEAAWLASNEREMERLKTFRHAVPEAVNLTIDERRKTDPRIAKLGTDLAVPDTELRRVFDLYRNGLAQAGLDHVKFGHIGDNHIHVNILPRDAAQYEAGRALYLDWARAVVAMGGTVSAEHGIGKLKTALLAEMAGPEGLAAMRALKTLFDPENRLNPGTLF